MGGTLNRLNCAKNKAQKNENVNIVPQHGSNEEVDDVMHRLETGNSPTKIEDKGRGPIAFFASPPIAPEHIHAWHGQEK